MRVPASELPDIRKIAAWARENLPGHYDLVDVRCAYGTDVPTMPEDWEIVIEFVDRIPEMAGSMEAIGARHAWSDPLIAKVRAEWPASTVRIAFKGREAECE